MAVNTLSFNIVKKEKFLGSLYYNLQTINTDFYDLFNNSHLHRYGLAINDVLSGNSQYEQILKYRNIDYTINNFNTEEVCIFSAKFIYQKNDTYPNGYSESFDRLRLVIDFTCNGIQSTWSSNMYYRYYSTIQSTYGYPFDYHSIKEFKYSVDRKSYYNIKMIDTKMLIIWKEKTKDRFIITKETHYNRNQNNPKNFPKIRKSNFLMSFLYGMIWDKNAYFHKIGEYDGDTSHVSNIKHTANLLNLYKYEVVYTNAKFGASIVTSPTVMGTYNFAPTASTEKHRIKDIIPYLMWGNSPLDNTLLKERFYFDYDEYKKGKNYTKRGISLYNAIELYSSLDINLDELSNRFENPIVDLSLFE